MKIGKRIKATAYAVIAALSLCFLFPGVSAYALGDKTGGGYAAGGLLDKVGYITELYDAANGLPTSDANFIFSDSEGYIWIGGYAGIIRYDGSSFERQTGKGLTSGRVIFEDSKGNMWIGTNDNGAVMISDDETVQFSVDEGLLSASVRTIGEDKEGFIYIGTTNGIAYVDKDRNLHMIGDTRLDNRTSVRFTADSEGTLYGNTADGAIFTLSSGAIGDFYEEKEHGISGVKTIYASPDEAGKIYIGTDSDVLFYGSLTAGKSNYERIRIAPAEDIYWITKACDRLWITSLTAAGYLDDNDNFHQVENIPLNNPIEMLTADYQGNLWMASTRQGVLKLVTSNFRDVTEIAGVETSAVNSTCFYKGRLYIGTDTGMFVLDEKYHPVQDELADFLENTRIRCIRRDNDGNLWVATYTNNMGLVCLQADGSIKQYTEENGLVNNKTRCIELTGDGSLLVCSNGGLNMIKKGEIVKTIGASDVVKNTYFLTVAEGDDGVIYAGSDGDGIYAINGDRITRIGRSDGLTSDVILRLKKDPERGVMWVITSNSIQYMKDGILKTVTSFPYNNNFDIYYDQSGNIWVLASAGVYCINADSMIKDRVVDYKLYTLANGLPGAPTSNSFSELDEEGNLYIAERTGVGVVNIDHYFEQNSNVILRVNSITSNGNEIKPGEDGSYIIPAEGGRIQITPAILDYSMNDPLVRIFLSGAGDGGVTDERSRISTLEYTDLAYGDYTLHIQIVDKTTKAVIQDEAFRIQKQPQLTELLIFRIFMVAVVALLVGIAVWRFMKITVIRRQYQEIRQARDEAERANTAKSRFLANMSHEIRTPISTIMGMDEMILREDGKDVPKGYFMNVVNYALDIRNASESLLGLVNDLLDISKIESGKMNLVEQEYDLQEMLRSVISMIRVRSNEKDLTFEIAVDEIMPTRLYGDVEKIKQIVLNLLTNAVKYTEIGGFKFTVSLESRNGNNCEIKFAVKDSGIGIKQEDMDKLFNAYERLDEEKNSGIRGTGLGLEISNRFAQIMGGSLTCTSVYGEGSEFVLTVTQKIVDSKPIGEFAEHNDAEYQGMYVPMFVAPDADVLVVDDNPMGLNIIKDLLKATRVFVTTASSGRECIEKMSNTKFNIVLLDHLMPGMDGIETLEKIREFDKETPVYAMTANSTMGEEFYISKGFSGYIAKPIDSKILEKSIMEHIPAHMMEKPRTEETGVPDIKEIPDDLLWIKEVEGIDSDEGIKRSGGIGSFIFGLNLFLDTLDETAAGIRNAVEVEDLKLLAVKLHALNISAGIIGAVDLLKDARELEEAANRGDKGYVDANAGKVMAEHLAFKDKLGRLKEKSR